MHGFLLNLLTIMDTTIGTSVFNMDNCLFESTQPFTGAALWDSYRLIITVLMMNSTRAATQSLNPAKPPRCLCVAHPVYEPSRGHSPNRDDDQDV